MIRRFCTLLVLLLLTGCTISSSPGPQPQAPIQPTATPTPLPPEVEIPEGGTLTVRLNNDVQPLQPWAPRSHEQEQMVQLVYRGLTDLDETLLPQPDIAQAWQSDTSGRILTMTLRPDLEWHDGVALTAADAAWTLTSLRDISPTTTLLADLQYVLTDVQAPTSTTLILQLREPYAPILSLLSMPVLPQHIWGSIPPEQLVEADFWAQPVGSGPFMFEERQADQVISFIRNEADPIQVPFLDRVAFVVAPDPSVASDALLQAELMAAELPWNDARSLLDVSDAQALLQAGAYPENAWYFLGYNLRPGHPFADPRLREALALIVTPDTLVDEVGSRALPISSDHLPGTWTATPAPEDREPAFEQARELLQSAGWVVPEGSAIRASNGVTLTVSLYVRGDDDRRVRVAEQIADLAGDIGMDIQVIPADFESVIRSKLAPPFDFDLALMSWTNGRVRSGEPSYAAYDPDNFALFHSSQIHQGAADSRQGLRNFVGFDDDSFDNLTMAARALYDSKQRQALYAQTADIVAEQRPYLFLWADQIPVVINKRVRSVQGEINLDTPMWLHSVAYWYFEE